MAVDTENDQKSPISIAGPKDYEDEYSFDSEEGYGFSQQLWAVVVCGRFFKLLFCLLVNMSSLFMHWHH